MCRGGDRQGCPSYGVGGQGGELDGVTHLVGDIDVAAVEEFAGWVLAVIDVLPHLQDDNPGKAAEMTKVWVEGA